jgi:hypothetical protein
MCGYSTTRTTFQATAVIPRFTCPPQEEPGNPGRNIVILRFSRGIQLRNHLLVPIHKSMQGVRFISK